MDIRIFSPSGGYSDCIVGKLLLNNGCVEKRTGLMTEDVKMNYKQLGVIGE